MSGPFCAHTQVFYSPDRIGFESFTESWKCKDCGALFVLLKRAAETLNGLHQRLCESESQLQGARTAIAELTQMHQEATEAVATRTKTLKDADAKLRDAWFPIAPAPTDGTRVRIYAPAYRDPENILPELICEAQYHPDGGWCVDELRFVTHWQPLEPSRG